VPRPERPLDPTKGPIQAFAADLRKLRHEAGNPKYLQMQRITGRSRTSLADAAGGDHLATWETVDAYVQACGGDVAEWEQRWTDARDTLRAQREQAAAPPHQSTVRPPARWLSSRPRLWVIAVFIGAAAVVVAFYALRSTPARFSPRSRLKAGVSSPAVIVVQNKVATGSGALTEDTTPAYLSTKPEPFCSHYGCEIAGTKMWSGAVLQALCVVHGAEMTNENTQSPGISRNKGGVFSSLWYWAETSNGTRGYLAQVYVAPTYRDLTLPTCSPGT
jgi:hypothetical protein